jgi:hypothetical protein
MVNLFQGETKPIIRPSLKELEERILEIKSLDLTFLSVDDIKSKLTLLFTGYTIASISLHLGSLVYRGIKYNTKPKLFSLLTYPPFEKAKMGRANREGVSVFYCTTDKNATFYELNTQPGDKLVISEWTVQRDLLINNVGYIQSVFTDLNSNRLTPIFSPTEEVDEDISNNENILVQTFFLKHFVKKFLKTILKFIKLQTQSLKNISLKKILKTIL